MRSTGIDMRRTLLLASAFLICVPFAAAADQHVSPVSYGSGGTGQYAVSIASVTKLTVPSVGTYLAQICVEGAAARYTDDGTTPTSTVGMPVANGQCFSYSGPLPSFQIIGAGATMDVSYYK